MGKNWMRGYSVDGLRLLRDVESSPAQPCGRCGAAGCPWDRIAGCPMCPDCQEALALGEAPPLREQIEPRPCAVCQRIGTLRYLTYPLHSAEPIEIDLCGGHFEALLGRRLQRRAFRRLSQQLQMLGVAVKQIFLLHEAFYDPKGCSLQPIQESW
jgi:hypothetical protein